MKRNKVVSADAAFSRVRDGWTLGGESFVGSGNADELCLAMERRYLETAGPKNLMVIHSSGPGDPGMPLGGLDSVLP